LVLVQEQFVAGIIGAPFGLHGFVKVKPLSGETEHLLRLKEAALRLDGGEKLFTIEESSAAVPAVLMRFAGYNSPEDAKALSGAELLVSREDAAPLRPGEYYVEDLKGLAVLDGDVGDAAGENASERQVIGRIAAIIEGGGGDLAEIQLNDGEKKLVPLRKQFFPDIDPQNGHIILKNLWILE
jgi:16S rRNA processing protein RimM